MLTGFCVECQGHGPNSKTERGPSMSTCRCIRTNALVWGYNFILFQMCLLPIPVLIVDALRFPPVPLVRWRSLVDNLFEFHFWKHVACFLAQFVFLN